MIQKVWIAEGCIVCRMCEVICGEVFDVRDDGCVVKKKAKLSHFDGQIEQAAAECPVKVIEFTRAKAKAKARR